MLKKLDFFFFLFYISILFKRVAEHFLSCSNLQHYFTVLFGHEGQKPLELRCEDEVDGDEWVEAIHQARYEA